MHHGVTEDTEDDEARDNDTPRMAWNETPLWPWNYRTRRMMPSFNAATLKLIRRPTRLPLRRR